MDSLSKQSAIFKAFCDENRLKILSILSNGEKCACDLIELTDLKQSRLAYHMKILSEAGVVKARQDGTWMRYTINRERIKEASDLLFQITKTKP